MAGDERRFARLTRLTVHNAPKGARIALTCKGRGCPTRKTRRRTVSRDLQRIDLRRAFRRARLGFGTRLTLRITAPQTIGRTYTYVVRRGQLPLQDHRVPRARAIEGPVVLRLLLAARAALLLAPATAAADGIFSVQGSTIVYDGDAGVDEIAGFDTDTSIRFTRFGGANLGGGDPCILSPDQQSIDCPKGAASPPSCSTSARATTSPPWPRASRCR